MIEKNLLNQFGELIIFKNSENKSKNKKKKAETRPSLFVS